jgi:chemotaxis protein MotB
MKDPGQVIILRKKHKHHGGHHGGAWKVAYADFVTAMMAFFLVMWLTTQSKEVKAAVAGYFRDPGVFDYQKSKGMLPGGKPGAEPGQAPAVTDPNDLKQEEQILREAAEHIKDQLTRVPEFATLRDQVEFTLTPEGLRVELVERAGSSFFDSGSAAMRGESERILSMIAGELGKLSNDVVVEGHTDSRPYAAGTGGNYGNWELSADRGNAARRIMERNGLRGGQLRAVRGYADSQLHLPSSPLDPRNRRVSIVVRSQAAAKLEQSLHTISGEPQPIAPSPAK